MATIDIMSKTQTKAFIKEEMDRRLEFTFQKLQDEITELKIKVNDLENLRIKKLKAKKNWEYKYE